MQDFDQPKGGSEDVGQSDSDLDNKTVPSEEKKEGKDSSSSDVGEDLYQFSDDIMKKFLVPKKFTEIPEIIEKDKKKILESLPKKIEIEPIKYDDKSNHKMINLLAADVLSFKIILDITKLLKGLGIVSEKVPYFKDKLVQEWARKKVSKINVKKLINGSTIKLGKADLIEVLDLFIQDNTKKQK